ncbi:hypothetical protein A4A49_40424 [Nicotiana attenuata]|uniref:Uncharacterized protein n=1 Tax=Nicotiana attenuata TaxID=49451 RepID=A0A1J6JR16_NICAT|nr:hypothetical protein A4A49_40424 [Nicotiana attenuata]
MEVKSVVASNIQSQFYQKFKNRNKFKLREIRPDASRSSQATQQLQELNPRISMVYSSCSSKSYLNSVNTFKMELKSELHTQHQDRINTQ